MKIRHRLQSLVSAAILCAGSPDPASGGELSGEERAAALNLHQKAKEAGDAGSFSEALVFARQGLAMVDPSHAGNAGTWYALQQEAFRCHVELGEKEEVELRVPRYREALKNHWSSCPKGLPEASLPESSLLCLRLVGIMSWNLSLEPLKPGISSDEAARYRADAVSAFRQVAGRIDREKHRDIAIQALRILAANLTMEADKGIRPFVSRENAAKLLIEARSLTSKESDPKAWGRLTTMLADLIVDDTYERSMSLFSEQMRIAMDFYGEVVDLPGADKRDKDRSRDAAARIEESREQERVAQYEENMMRGFNVLFPGLFPGGSPGGNGGDSCQSCGDALPGGGVCRRCREIAQRQRE